MPDDSGSGKRDALDCRSRFLCCDGRCRESLSVGMPWRDSMITAINIVGGLYLGDLRGRHGTSPTPPAVFTKLTIGDGLGQSNSIAVDFPLPPGVLVTRGIRKSNLADNFVTQLLGNSQSTVHRRWIPNRFGGHRSTSRSRWFCSAPDVSSSPPCWIAAVNKKLDEAIELKRREKEASAGGAGTKAS